MKHIPSYVLVILLCVASLSHAQTKIDSLKKIIDTGINLPIEEQLTAHRLLAHEASKNDPNLSLNYSQKGLEMALAAGDDNTRASLLRSRGIAYMVLGATEESLRHLIEALKLYEAQDALSNQARVMNDIGLLYLESGKPADSKAYFVNSLAIKEEMGDKVGELTALSNLGYYAFVTNDLDQAMAFSVDMLERAQALDNEYAVFIALSNIANVHENWDDEAKAVDFYTQAMEITKYDERPHAIATIKKDFGRSQVRFKKYQEGLVLLKEGYQLCKDNGFREILPEILTHLAKAYDGLGEPEMAYRYQLEYTNLKDSLSKINSTQSYTQMQALLKLEKKQQLIDDQALEIDVLHASQRSNTVVWIVGGLFMALLCGFGLFAYGKMKVKLSKQSDLIKHKDNEIANYALSSVDKASMLQDLTSDSWRQGGGVVKEEVERMLVEHHTKFKNALLSTYPQLSAKEVKICALLQMKLSSKEIAEVMNLSSKSVDTYRYNIRKKMELTSSDSFQDHLDSLV